jgi:hypothetical protein
LFRAVNLQRAVFDDVNLAEVRIRNGFLAGLSIEDSFVGGLTVNGFRVDLLIEAELDRRDPERIRLRMTDTADPECVRAVLNRLDVVREEFRALVRSTDRSSLTTRPGPESWSVVETIRHMLFAADMYLNRRLLQNAEPLSRLGLLSTHLVGHPRLAEVGSEPTDDAEALLAAWDEIHARTRELADHAAPEELRRDTSQSGFGPGTVGEVLQTLAQHDLSHIRQAEAALAKVSGNSGNR